MPAIVPVPEALEGDMIPGISVILDRVEMCDVFGLVYCSARGSGGGKVMERARDRVVKETVCERRRVEGGERAAGELLLRAAVAPKTEESCWFLLSSSQSAGHYARAIFLGTFSLHHASHVKPASTSRHQLHEPALPHHRTLHSPQTDFAMAVKPITGVRAAIERPRAS